jgi:hypothetical protein
MPAEEFVRFALLPSSPRVPGGKAALDFPKGYSTWKFAYMPFLSNILLTVTARSSACMAVTKYANFHGVQRGKARVTKSSDSGGFSCFQFVSKI